MVKKYKYIIDLEDYSDIASRSSAEMNTEKMHPENRRSNTDSVENLDSANNARRSFCA